MESSPTVAEKVLCVKHLEVGFHTEQGIVTALRDLNFTLPKGKIIGVLGESGCGKSVLALSIMGLLEKGVGFIKQGEIYLENKELTALSEKDYTAIRGNEIAMIFQEPMTSLNPVMTVGNQIGEALAIHQGLKGKVKKEKVLEMLNAVHIPEPIRVYDEYPHQLSGGMRQRVMIAMALSCKPKLLIADEPTTALDVTIQAQILSLLKELNTTLQTTILFITHDLGVMAEIADEVMVFYAGKVVEHTTIEALFDAPKHPYTQGLLRSRPIHAADGYLPSIKGNVPSLSAMPKGCAFAPRCEKALPICFEKQPLETLDAENKSVACFLYEEGEEK